MPFGPFTLQWRAPCPNPPKPSPLPEGITRSYIPTPSGNLELLSAIPVSPTSKPPLFFQHGGFGCAEVWLNYMLYFREKGYPCYALSVRGHGGSWYPGFLRMYFTARGTVAGDVVRGIEWVEKEEAVRRGEGKEEVKVVLIGHSAGGALSQWILSKALVKVEAFVMLAAVPGFGSFSCYKFWAPTAAFHFPYRFFHPRYILVTTAQVQQAFFLPSTPIPIVKNLERLLSPYESMLWPLQGLFPFVRGPDVMRSIRGWRLRSDTGKVTERLLVLAAELDVLCTPILLLDAARRYRAGFRELVKRGMVDGVLEEDLGGKEEESVLDGDGVAFRVVRGVPHHLQNVGEWERGAGVVLEWLGRL